MDFNFLLTELLARANLKKDDVQSLVDKKYSEMRDLITKEGAVYLVAKEFDVDLPDISLKTLPIKNLKSGMRNVSVVGRIFRISKINEFSRSDSSMGRVANIFIGDSTGFVRIPLWDDQVKLLEEGSLSIGDVVQVNNGLAKDNVFGDVEVSLGRFGTINAVDHIELPPVEELSKMFMNIVPERTDISYITPGGNFEIRGTVVQLFKGNFIFETCPLCGNKVENSRCGEHGDINPSHALVLSFVVDDGTGDLRCVLFRELAEKLCDIKAEGLSQLNPDERHQILNTKLVGRNLVLLGRVRSNKMFDRIEMIVTDFKDINPLEESNRLVDELELTVGA